jgi:hypothetical protein
MAQFIDDLLSDFDAEFGLNSQVGAPSSSSQGEAAGPSPRIPRSRPPSAPRSAPDRSASDRRLSAEQASAMIADLRRQRVRDAERMQQLQTENARLVAKLTILQHTDLKVAELGARIEQLLQKYLGAEQIRQQQAAQITEIRQQVIVLKSRVPPHEQTPRGAAGKQ